VECYVDAANSRLRPPPTVLELFYYVSVLEPLVLVAGTTRPKPFVATRPGGGPMYFVSGRMIAGVHRRTLLSLLRKTPWSVVEKVATEAAGAGYKSAAQHLTRRRWECTVTPLGRSKGMCGYCPVCTLFGAVLNDDVLNTKRPPLAIRSRIFYDPAYTVGRAELVHWDGALAPGETVGHDTAPVTYTALPPGTVLIGKLALLAPTEAEARLAMNSFLSITRLGARRKAHGRVRIEPLAYRCGEYESLSAYEVAGAAETLNFARKLLSSAGFRPGWPIGPVTDELLATAWREAAEFAAEAAKTVSARPVPVGGGGDSA